VIPAGLGAGWRTRCLAAVLIPLILWAGLVRPVRVAVTGGSPETIWLWAWQKGRIDFVNSVTHRPVAMTFGLPWRFSGFSARTDPGTEEYYTAGGYSWNEQLAKERPRQLNYCSEVGLDVTLGDRIYRQQGGCVTLSLLWPL
jgi:hypothetical protein